jgi:hypothetical protein
MAHTFETSTYPQTETLTERGALLRARNDFYKVSALFEDHLEARDGSDTTHEPAIYWRELAQFAKDYVATELSTPEQLARGRLLEMTAMTPLAAMAQNRLNHLDNERHAHNGKRKSVGTLVKILSHYNDSVRTAALDNTSLTPSGVMEHIDATIGKTTGHSPENFAYAVVRGAQMELIGGQMLAAAADDARGVTMAEDLSGIDYVCTIDKRTVGVNIKASERSIGTRTGRYQPLDVYHGVVLFAPPINEAEIGDHFLASEESVIKHSPMVRLQLGHIIHTRGSSLRRIHQ